MYGSICHAAMTLPRRPSDDCRIDVAEGAKIDVTLVRDIVVVNSHAEPALAQVLVTMRSQMMGIIPEAAAKSFFQSS